MDDSERRVKAETLQDHRAEFQSQDGGIEHDAPGHLEHHRVGIPHNQRVPDAVGESQVEQEPHNHQQVAQEGGEDGRANDGTEPLQVEEVHGGRDGETPCGQAHADHHVEPDPDPPGELVGQVGRCAQPPPEAHGRGVEARHHDDGGHAAPECQLRPDPVHRSPPSAVSCASDAWPWSWFRRLTIHQRPNIITPPVAATFGSLDRISQVSLG